MRIWLTWAALGGALWLGAGAWAAPGWAAQGAALFAQPSTRAGALRVVGAGERLDLRRCSALWCFVRVGEQDGWVLRAAVNMAGGCEALVPVGLKDLRRHEAAYSAQRDPDGNGRACDQRDFLQITGR
ncbi:hypothetical protein [Deinococcus multiflagellatus]|uniref:SH3 domain-containing protein n=1 Tax=Deinococcus multiflagellatus TaxID=1656887 RepID=A0ABW1ZR92_9DEIO|nr:hypothetical protein [Deinococcus multiflagellatus]MBZ9714708.1 hypothetical protein [Deinococcus multiflagellatus]